MTTVVIMPGGFHPFHAGHLALYQSAQRAFSDAEVFVAATNDTSARPFPFAVKEKLAKLAGVEPGHFVQVKSPFRAEEITSRFDPARDTLIFVRSEKDATKQPQSGGIKKDGNPAYLQPLMGAKRLEPFAKHAYMAYLPTVEFGPGMTSATEIRGAWPQLDDKRKTALIMSLYPKTQGNPKLAQTVVKLLDTAMGSGLDEDLSRRGFLKGAGAAAVAGAGLAPKKAQSNVLIPILQGIAQSMLGTQINNQIYADVACAPRGIKVGQKVMFRGETQEVKKIYGEHPYCKNPDLPIAVKVGKPDPVQEPKVQQSPNQQVDPDLEQKRRENMARMASSGPSNTYGQRITARIKPNIVFTSEIEGNPVAEVEVRQSPDGTIVSRKLLKSSGNTEWDQAVIKAIDKTQQLSRDIDGRVYSPLIISFSPKDTLPNESVEQGVAEVINPMTANTSGAGAGMTACYQARENQPMAERHIQDYVEEARS